MKTFWTGFEKRAMSLPGKNVVKAISGGLEKATVPAERVLDYRLFSKARPQPTVLNYSKMTSPKVNPAYQAAADAKSQALSKARLEYLKRQSTPRTYWQEALKEPVTTK
jgi:hypothetical protein